MNKKALALKYKIKNKKEQVKHSKFLLAVLMLSIGVSWTVVYYEYPILRNDYNKAITIYNRSVESRIETSDVQENSIPEVEEVSTASSPAEELSVEEQIEKVALEHGFTDTELLKKMAFCESSLNPNATNNTSTATGLYQFLEGTWQEGCKATGNDWTLEDRTDVEKATRMAIYFIAKGQISRWNASAHCWNS